MDVGLALVIELADVAELDNRLGHHVAATPQAAPWHVAVQPLRAADHDLIARR